MNEIKLEAKNATEKRVLDYLVKNASEVLAAKINAGTKTLRGALDYCKDEARKLADGEGCVCVDDETVFGWIIHYFEEEHITEKAKAPATRVPAGVTPLAKRPVKAKAKPAPAPAKPAKAPEADPQLTMFEMLMGGGK